jgi:hypothetical protein
MDRQSEIDRLQAKLKKIDERFKTRKQGQTLNRFDDMKHLKALPRILARLRELGVKGGRTRRRRHR